VGVGLDAALLQQLVLSKVPAIRDRIRQVQRTIQRQGDALRIDVFAATEQRPEDGDLCRLRAKAD